MARIFKNFDVTSLYPSEIEIFGYSSRSQKNKDSYIDLLHMRKKAKHGLLEESFLKQFDLTNDDLKSGLKLPLNAYSGALRAKFNKLYDNLQGFSICTTGQLLLLQLMHDLDKIPTLEFVSANTDAVAYTIEEEYQPLAQKALDEWQEVTGLELEEDNVVKIIMRDVNNYVEIVQTGENDYSVNYKGGTFTGKHIFKWDKNNRIFRYSFNDDVKGNSMTIVSEAVLKYLLFGKSIEETINNCEDIFRFQIITHLGHTYQKMVQESENGDVELQRNNRVYAGLKPSGTLVKVKSDGRRDSLANCPDNPIIDNANECSMKDINKNWYIRVAKQRVEDFLGTGKQILKGRKKLMKKDELIEENERLTKELEKLQNMNDCGCVSAEASLYRKINEFRKKVRGYKFVLDCVMDDKHGGAEYSSLSQLYDCVQELCIEVGLDFSFDSVEEIRFERNILTPSMGAPRHLSEVRCIATLTDIDTGLEKRYSVLGAGSDTTEKSLSGAESMAFRKWFTMNFTPKGEYDWDKESDKEVTESVTTEAPKIPAYIPQQAKQEIKEQVVATEQHDNSDQEDIDSIIDTIMEIRELTKDAEYGKAQLLSLQKGECDTPTINSLKLAVENRLASIKAGA